MSNEQCSSLPTTVWHPAPETMQKQWQLLQTNDKIQKSFETPLIISFERKKSQTNNWWINLYVKNTKTKQKRSKKTKLPLL